MPIQYLSGLLVDEEFPHMNKGLENTAVIGVSCGHVVAL